MGYYPHNDADSSWSSTPNPGQGRITSSPPAPLITNSYNPIDIHPQTFPQPHSPPPYSLITPNGPSPPLAASEPPLYCQKRPTPDRYQSIAPSAHPVNNSPSVDIAQPLTIKTTMWTYEHRSWTNQLCAPHAIAKKIVVGGKTSGGDRTDDSHIRQPKRTHTIDNVTQVVDLTTKIRITSSEAVSHGGFSDIYQGEWGQETEMTSIPSGESNKDAVAVTRVAVKLLRVFTRKDVDLERSRKRLNREVNIWKRLNHPNIARFYGISFQLGGRPSLVMQWYDNGTAPSYTKDHSITSKLNLVKEVGAGLRYLHNLLPPVVHGDLKGNNILVDDEGHAVLSDFGLSKVIDELSGPTGNTTTTLAGSVRWQAPELLFDGEEEEEEDPLSPPSSPSLLSDVWSFGCTAYELLTGHLPYHHRMHDWTVIQDVMRGVSPLRPEDAVIHRFKDLLDILNDCWALMPEKRPDMDMVNSRLEMLQPKCHL